MTGAPELTPAQIAASRESSRQHEANMAAIESIYLNEEERRFFAELDAEAVGYEEGVERTTAYLRARGIIPATPETDK